MEKISYFAFRILKHGINWSHDISYALLYEDHSPFRTENKMLPNSAEWRAIFQLNGEQKNENETLLDTLL